MFDSIPKLRDEVRDSKKINSFNISGFLVILFEDNAPIDRLQASVTFERHVVARVVRERDVPHLAPVGTLARALSRTSVIMTGAFRVPRQGDVRACSHHACTETHAGCEQVEQFGDVLVHGSGFKGCMSAET